MTCLAGMLACFHQIGAIPRTVVWDGEGCIGQWRGGKEVFTEDFQRFRGTLGTGARLCKPNDPEAKGMNERANGYYETSFLPGRHFASWPTSTSSWPRGWSGPTAGSTAPSGSSRPS